LSYFLDAVGWILLITVLSVAVIWLGLMGDDADKLDGIDSDIDNYNEDS
jgi:hypothetical protein